MSFNRGKVIAVDPKTQKKPNPWAKDVVVNFDQRNNLMPNTMNLPEGYHMMPDGTIMADPSVTVPVGQVGVTDEQLNPTKKKTKKKAKRKAKKKKA